MRDPGGRQRGLRSGRWRSRCGRARAPRRAACRRRARRRSAPATQAASSRSCANPRVITRPPAPRAATSALAVRCAVVGDAARRRRARISARERKLRAEHDPAVLRVALAEAQDVARLGRRGSGRSPGRRRRPRSRCRPARRAGARARPAPRWCPASRRRRSQRQRCAQVREPVRVLGAAAAPRTRAGRRSPTRCSARSSTSTARQTAATSAAGRVRGGCSVGVGGEQAALGERDLRSRARPRTAARSGERLLDLGAPAGRRAATRSRAAGRPGRRSCRRRCGRTAPACSRSSRAQTEWKVAAVTPRARCSPSRSVEPQPQLAGGADAERDGEDLARRAPAGGEQVRDAVGERAGLAGAGAGHDQQRAGAVADGVRLLGREARVRAPGSVPGGRGWAHPRRGGSCITSR